MMQVFPSGVVTNMVQVPACEAKTSTRLTCPAMASALPDSWYLSLSALMKSARLPHMPRACAGIEAPKARNDTHAHTILNLNIVPPVSPSEAPPEACNHLRLG